MKPGPIFCLSLAALLSVACQDTPSGVVDPASGSGRHPAGDLYLYPSPEPFGVVANGPIGDPAKGPQILDFASDANVGWIRITIYWYLMQPRGGATPDSLAPLDPDYVAEIRRVIQYAQQRGLKIVATLNDSPDWVRHCAVPDPGPDCGKGYSPHLPPHASMYIWWQRYVSQMVQTFPEITYWSIWNEPNAPRNYPYDTTPFMTADIYATLIAYAQDVPEFRGTAGAKRYMVVGELAKWGAVVDYLSTVLGSVGSRTDIVAVHWYGYAQETEDAMSAIVTQTRNNIGYWQWPLWLTESNGEHTRNNPDVQARFLTQVYTRMLSGRNSWWQKTFFFNLVAEDEAYQLVDGLSSMDSGGTLVPRKAWYCLQAVAYQWLRPDYCEGSDL